MRTHYARFWCRAPVGPFQAVRAPPRFLPRSRAPPFEFCGGWPGPLIPLPGLGLLTPLRAGLPLASWLCSLWERLEGARGGGGGLLPRYGASGVGRSPTPDRPSLGRAAGARYPLAAGAGGVGVGTRHQPHSARSCELALRTVWAARGSPRGRRLWPGLRAAGAGRSPTPDRPSLGRAVGARCPLAVGAGGVGVGTRHQPNHACYCELALRCRGGQRAPGEGGRLLSGCGASGVWYSPRPDRPSLKPVAGACYPLALGAAGLGVGTSHQPHSARS